MRVNVVWTLCLCVVWCGVGGAGGERGGGGRDKENEFSTCTGDSPRVIT